MKPTLEQEEILKKYLREAMLYRETYEEVYDHIFVALENKSEEISFQNAVNEILKDDFGGGKGVVKMEKQHLREASWKGYVKMVKYVKADFLFPNIFYTIILFGAITYTIQNITIDHDRVIPIISIVAIGFLIFILIRTFFVGYLTGDTRKSISDIVIGKLIGSLHMFSLFPLMFYPIYKKQYQDIMIQHPIIAGIITTYILFIVATIRISIEEFRTYKTT